MLKGKYSDNILEDAKKNLVISLKMGTDNNVAILNNYVFHYLDELPLLEERIKMIQNTQKEDLIRCAKSLVLNTIYVQKTGENNARN